MDNQDESMPEVTKQESKLIKEIIGSLIDTPLNVANDKLLSVLTQFQVAPEKQLKLTLSLAYELSVMADETEADKTLSNHYLKLSTIATEFVQEKFGSPAQEEGTTKRKARAAKNNAKINMASYFGDVEPALFDESDDEGGGKRKRTEEVVWSDSELQETAPIPPPPKVVETLTSDEEEEETAGAVPADLEDSGQAMDDEASARYHISKELFPGSASNVLTRRQTKVYDVVCIETSSEDDNVVPIETTPPHETIARATEYAARAIEPVPRPGTIPRRTEPIAPVVDRVAHVTSPSGLPHETREYVIAKPPVKKRRSRSNKQGKAKVSSSAIKKILGTAEQLQKKEEESTVQKISERPVGVVIATPRATPTDARRATANTIRADEALILNFKKGHYPTFQTHHSHLAVAEKPQPSLYVDTAPSVSDVLALDTKVIKSDELKLFDLKQLVHNASGQYLVAERNDTTYLIVPGVINKKS